MFGFLSRKRKIEDLLYKRVVLHGVEFVIKRLDPSNFLDGSKVMLQVFDVYKLKQPGEKEANETLSKIKEHYRDVFMAAVVSPALKRKPEGDGLLVDNLFTEWNLSHELYFSIMEFTYGKKKLKQSSSQNPTL
jgi:hypothetical protein